VGGCVWGPYTRFPEREGTRKLNFFVGSAREEGRTFLHDFVPWSGDLLGGTCVKETESGESDSFPGSSNETDGRSGHTKNDIAVAQTAERNRTISAVWPIISRTSSRSA